MKRRFQNKKTHLIQKNSEMDRFYTRLDLIGAGAYGVVYKAQPKEEKEKGTDHFVAIKQMRPMSRNTRPGVGIPQDAYREIKLLFELGGFPHENIIHLDKVYMKPKNKEGDATLYLVYDYCEHDLADMIRSHRQPNSRAQESDMIRSHRQIKSRMQESVAKSILWQCLNGLKYLHSNWIMHRDMKPANILLTSQDKKDEPGRVKIADFGLARIFQSPLRKLSDDGDVVTIWYRAPELLLGSKHYTRAIDIWALGCIFAELIVPRPLFPGDEKSGSSFQSDQLQRIFTVLGLPNVQDWPHLVDHPEYPHIEQWSASESHFENRLHEKLNLSQNSATYKLLRQMLCFDPSQRITAAAALEHEYFQDKPSKNAFENLKTPYKKRRALPPEQQKRQPAQQAAPPRAASSSNSSTRTTATRRAPMAAQSSSSHHSNFPSAHSTRSYPSSNTSSQQQHERHAHPHQQRRQGYRGTGSHNSHSSSQSSRVRDGVRDRRRSRLSPRHSHSQSPSRSKRFRR